MSTTQPGYILVVDDIPDILALIDATLQFKGYRVVTARDGLEALETIQQNRPALVIADILMPKMDGFGLLHRIRIDPNTRDIPVIFLSATYISQEDKEFARAIGVTSFIEKPVELERFLPIISDILEGGEPATPLSLNEYEFYDRYRKRLETKLHQKMTQIARDEHLIRTLPEAERMAFESTLHQTIKDRDEIKLLLSEIQERMESLGKRD
jgi:CheY-like chemotaxis protein